MTKTVLRLRNISGGHWRAIAILWAFKFQICKVIQKLANMGTLAYIPAAVPPAPMPATQPWRHWRRPHIPTLPASIPRVDGQQYWAAPIEMQACLTNTRGHPSAKGISKKRVGWNIPFSMSSILPFGSPVTSDTSVADVQSTGLSVSPSSLRSPNPAWPEPPSATSPPRSALSPSPPSLPAKWLGLSRRRDPARCWSVSINRIW